MLISVQGICPEKERAALLGAFFFVDWFSAGGWSSQQPPTLPQPHFSLKQHYNTQTNNVSGGISTGFGEINAWSVREKLLATLPLLIFASALLIFIGPGYESEKVQCEVKVRRRTAGPRSMTSSWNRILDLKLVDDGVEEGHGFFISPDTLGERGRAASASSQSGDDDESTGFLDSPGFCGSYESI